MKFKEVTASDIEAIKYLFYMDKNQPIIKIQCEKYKLTKDFVNQFKNEITKEMFSASPLLSYELIKRYPDLFDLNIWVENLNKSAEPLLHKDFVDLYGKDLLREALLKIDYSLIPKEVFEDFYSVLTAEDISTIINKASFLDENFIVKHANDLTSSIFKNRNVKFKWSNSLIEKILENKLLTVRFLINILEKSEDPGFIKRMLTQKFSYKVSGETFDSELKVFINKIHDDYMVSLFDLLKKYSPNALSQDVLIYTLEFKSFLSEEFIIDNATKFIENGLKGKLTSYAREKGYDSTMVLLRLMD